jgi:predicted AlkP superfamily pyrophosphatase or phosphodiesterase
VDGRVDEACRALKGRNPHLTVYRLADLRRRYHYEAGPRMAPLVAVAEEGWLPTTHARRRHGRQPKGMHGYGPEAPGMRALFIANGPSFRRSVVVPPFENVHLYSLMAALLGLHRAPGDGALDSVPPMLVETR